MLAVSKLYCSRPPFGGVPGINRTDSENECRVRLHVLPLSAAQQKPAVVWNATRTCNLNCPACTTNSGPRKYRGEMTGEEARGFIRNLASFGVAELRFAGGEPLVRVDLPDLVACASDCGIRPALITNGTLVTPAVARRLADSGVESVSVRLDALEPDLDRLRGTRGSLQATLAGLRCLREAGLRVSLRVALTKRNQRSLDGILDFVERERIERVCFHHLVYAGRGNDPSEDLTHGETRRAMDLILRRAEDFEQRGVEIEIFTADNDVDGVYLYLKLSRKDPVRAAAVYRHLELRGGGAGSSGVGIASVDAGGNVHPDSYWSHYSFGNVREKSFGSIWTDQSDPLTAGLKNRLPLLKGRCANCRFKKICGGSLRVRAERVYGDPWMEDPACYLTQEEIAGEWPQFKEAMENDVLTERQAA